MNKRFLPAIAALLILTVALVPSSQVFAQAQALRAQAVPSLSVLTIPEDDEVLNTGIILLAGSQAAYQSWLANSFSTATTPVFQKLLAQYKLFVSFNGLPVYPSSFSCQVIEKDKANPIKDRQATWENLKTVPVDQTASFVCKLRWGKPGVGVIDIYWTNAAPVPALLADYIVVVRFDYTIGRTVVYGTEIQDICVLGWPDNAAGFAFFTKPDGSVHGIWPNPLGNWLSCEELALYQKHTILGLPVPWT